MKISYLGQNFNWIFFRGII